MTGGQSRCGRWYRRPRRVKYGVWRQIVLVALWAAQDAPEGLRREEQA